VSRNNTDDDTLDTLLQLDGEVFPMDNGCWVKFEIKRVAPSRNIPHGIKYSLTFHDRHNRRIIGFDNAHAFKSKRKRFGATKITWDHKHHKEQISAYDYESAGQLLEDFSVAVEKYLKG